MLFLSKGECKTQQHQDTFLEVLFESIATAQVTVEHEYLALLFKIDGFQHHLLHGINCIPLFKESVIRISILDFLDFRLSIVKCE